MMPRLPILFLAAAAAEIASIIWVGQWLGVVPTLVLMILGGIVGVNLIKSAGMSVAAALRTPVQTASPLRGLGAQAAARTASGLLLLLPGFFSDFLGLLLFLPPVRDWLASRLRIDIAGARPAADDRRFGPVIDAEAVEISAEIKAPDPRKD